MTIHRLKVDAPVRSCGEKCVCGKWKLPADLMVCDDHLSHILASVAHLHVRCPECNRELRFAVPFDGDDDDAKDDE